MSTYQLRLTPELRNLASEGSLDTAVVMVANPNTTAGQPATIPVSVQRSGYMTTAAGGVAQDVKVTEMADGAEFTDTLETIVTVLNGSGGNSVVPSV